MEETDNICFVCDKTIPSEKWKYKLQVTATKKRNVPVADLIKQLVGDEYAVLVGERDAVCSRCMNLLNLMDSLTVQLGEVQTTLSQLLHSKYNLASEATKFQVEYDDSAPKETEPLHKCDSCSFQTRYEKEFYMHIRIHETPKPLPEKKSTPKTVLGKKPTPKSIISKSSPKQSLSKRVSGSTRQKGARTLISKPPPVKLKTRANKPGRKRKSPFKSSASLSKKQSKKAPKQKRTKVVFQCSLCDKIFSSESLIRTHAKKVHGNNNIVVSDDEYEDIQTLESPDEELQVLGKAEPEKESDFIKTPKSEKRKLDFLDDWEEDYDNDDLSSPKKLNVVQNDVPEKAPKIKNIRRSRSKSKSVEIEDDEKDTSSNPTCLFCHAKFSSFESVQDHIKLSHRDQNSHFIGSKTAVISPSSVASFEIDSTTDISENKKQTEDGDSECFPTHKSYKCNLCGIKKVSLEFIQQHVKAHKRKLSLQCKLCGTTFKNIVALKVHASKCHKVASILKKCSYCKFKFFDIVQLKNHVRKVHYKKPKKVKFSIDRRNSNLVKDEADSDVAEGSVKSELKLTNIETQELRNGNMIKKGSAAVDTSKISFSEVSSTSFETETEPEYVKYNCTLCNFVTDKHFEMKGHIESQHGENGEENMEDTLQFTKDNIKKKTKLECPECCITFKKPSRLGDHMNRHKANTCLNLGICMYCNKLFMDKEQVVLHISITHESVKVKPKCNICGKTYSYAKDLKVHYLRAHFSDKTDKLMKQVVELKTKAISGANSEDANDIYSKVFKELQDITGEGNDVEDVSIGKTSQILPLTYSCPLCKFSCSDQVAVQNHLMSHTQNYCNICKNIFVSQEAIKHIENHSIEFQDKKCSECEERFHDEVHLQFHVQKVHPENKPHKCSMCIKSYFSERSMLNHKQTKHGKKSKKVFTCTECRVNFYSEKEYQTHIEFAHRSSMNCKYCDKSFSEIKRLILHEKNHLKQVKSIYKCNICGKVLKSQLALKTHKINHTSNKPLQCEECNQHFKSFHTLREHSAKHSETQEKKYFCDICGKGFYFYDSHYRHRRIHLDPLLFQCKICRERFQTNQKLLEHNKTCKTPKCTKCRKSFKTLSDLKKHVCLLKQSVAFS